ncbi:ABC transporter permease [Alloacidobacterium dinghuense]|uniref:ABC transporter permease n=1 Tax=Alloacidobacterium dinghuense TaxID=2763107 RepID=A0A7G8BIA0_9BACT|nr:FtsX-like permease family protein [Alloacidobacterium dinghuense]QNI32270.1 ABC transporter permease [Alloacidobacterium dinghuense]
MNKLVIGNLLHRPLRTMIGIVAVAVEVVMILSIVGIMIGQISNARNQTSGIGADMIVRPPNASFITGVGGAPVPAKIADVLAKLPHVAVAAPVITDFNMGGSVETIWGIDYESFNALKPFVYLSGTTFQGPNDVIVDDIFARADGGHKVGQTIQVKNHPFRICGIVEHGKGGRKFLPIHTLGGMVGNADNASLFYLKSDDVKNQDAIRQEILSTPGLGQYQVQTLQEWMSLMTPEHLPGFSAALNSVIGIAVIVGFIVVFQAMYTAVMERTREIGILKSLGASQGYIANAVLREAALVAIAGIILGIAMTYIIKIGLEYRFPTLPFPLTLQWRVRGALIAFGGSILGALYPALKAARKDPIDALAYE